MWCSLINSPGSEWGIRCRLTACFTSKDDMRFQTWKQKAAQNVDQLSLSFTCFLTRPTNRCLPTCKYICIWGVLFLRWIESDIITKQQATLHWLPVRQRVLFKTAVLVWKCLHDAAPRYLADLCVRLQTVVASLALQSPRPSWCPGLGRLLASAALLRMAPGPGTDYQQPSYSHNCRSLHSSASSRPTRLFQHIDGAGCSCGCRVPSSGAVVTVQRVRRRLQMSRLDSKCYENVKIPKESKQWYFSGN